MGQEVPFLSIINYSHLYQPSLQANQPPWSGTGQLPPYLSSCLEVTVTFGTISRFLCSLVLPLPAAEHTSMLAVIPRLDNLFIGPLCLCLSQVLRSMGTRCMLTVSEICLPESEGKEFWLRARSCKVAFWWRDLESQ